MYMLLRIDTSRIPLWASGMASGVIGCKGRQYYLTSNVTTVLTVTSLILRLVDRAAYKARRLGPTSVPLNSHQLTNRN